MWKKFAPSIAFFTVIAAFGAILPVPGVINFAQVTRSTEVEPDFKLAPAEEALANLRLLAANIDDAPKSAEVESDNELFPAEETLATLENAFRCTIYYTPRESGFTAEAGFDTAPETRPGLNGQQFPRDFLVSVQKEGYGRICEPIDGNDYISYCRGKWGFAETPLDCRNKPLVPRQSCAAKGGQKLIRQDSKFRVSGERIPADFEDLRWVVTDTGSGLNAGQLDLYWGEDDPHGPGKGITRPKGSPSTIEQATIIVLR